MRYFKPISFALMFLLLAILAVCLASSLPGCSFIEPQKGIVLNLAAQNCGFVLAQKKPALIGDVLGYSKTALEILQPAGYTELVFHTWASRIIEILKLDPFLEMNFKEMVKLVQVEILLTEDQQEISQLVYDVTQSFIRGIKAGR